MMSLNFGIVCASLLTLANSLAPITNITIEKGCNLMSCSDISWTPGCIEIPSTGSMEKTCSCPGAPCPTCCLYGCKSGAWKCLVGGNCVEGVCPSISSGECEDNGCDKAYDGKGESGICVPTNKDGWNVIYKDIDFSTPMKTGLCKSQDGDAGCCGCFKQKIEKCEDKKCIPIPKKKIHRECVKKGEAVELNLFNTGRKCQKREDCHCYQKCKPNKKCEKHGGKCLGSAPKWPYQKILKPCDRKKKCICYIPIGISSG